MGGTNSTLGGYSQNCSLENPPSHHHDQPAIALARFKLAELNVYLTILTFMLVVMLLKLIYNKVPHFSSYFPESLLLMLVGLTFGAMIRYMSSECSSLRSLRLSPNLFFNILLPPIMLESAYSIYNKKFAGIISTILLFAVVGTIFNFLFIGVGLYLVDLTIGLGEPNLHLGIKEFLLFSSLIVAVDPVAVLAVFQDIGVDLNLYYMVFGESLLNDAVTIVLYNIMSAFVVTTTITSTQIATGIGSFFTVSLGGALIGLIHGIFTCFLTRFEMVSETIGVLISSYMAYLVADLFAWSGIISIIVCGVFQSAYAFHNLSPLSVMVLESAVEQLASISESIIFLLLGSEVFAINLQWHTGFILTSLILCIAARFVVTTLLAAIVNRRRTKQTRITWSEQIIISYGGLRGAVAFSLAILINAESLGDAKNLARDVQVTTAIAVIFFTVAFMGTTMKPLVRLLNIRLHSEKTNNAKLFITLNKSVMEDILIFIEELISSPGVHSYYRALSDFDDKYIRPILQRDAATHEKKILNAYEKLALKYHSEAIAAQKKESSSSTQDLEPTTTTEKAGLIPDIIQPHEQPRHKFERRLTLAALSSVGPEVAFMHRKNIDFASAQRAQFAKVNRSQASFARTMDMHSRMYESASSSPTAGHKQGKQGMRRGHLTRQMANVSEYESSAKRKANALTMPAGRVRWNIPSLLLTSMDELREDLETIDDEETSARTKLKDRSKSIDSSYMGDR